ncbi:MAG: hypothetical protein K2I71_08280, partial [Helicobacter sp.]|nr:hypothetical protein [Helicobacter sp.]
IHIFMLIALQAFSQELLSYDPFFYEEDYQDKHSIKVLGIMDTKVNLNGRWYQIKESFRGLLIKEIQGDCVILGEEKICWMEKRFLED